MTIEERLESLDEAIWKVHEKVANAAYNKLGWDKWLLTNVCMKITAGSLLGVGIYDLIRGTIEGNGLRIGMGAVISGASIYFGKWWTKENKREKEIEEKKLRGEVVYRPTSKPWRPFIYLSSAVFAGSAILSMGPSEMFSPQGYKDAVTLGKICGAIYCSGSASMSYFSDQIPMPPKKRKELLRAAYDLVTKPFRSSTSELQPQEITNGQYQSLEDIAK